jgi:tRNA dimethylallyltransferase
MINERAASAGWPALHADLARLDPRAAARISGNDPQRIQRALEVCYLSGEALSELQARTRAPALRFARWALVPLDRRELHRRLEARLEAMLEAGLLDELRALQRASGSGLQAPALRAVGYRQLWPCVSAQADVAAATQKALAATRQLAKRQLTWINADGAWRKIDPFAANAYETLRAEVLTIVRGGASPAVRAC